MKVFIIGGTGLLGSEAAKVLIERGHKVTAIALPPLPAGAELPPEMKIEFGNYLEMTDDEIRAQFTGMDALVFAAGVDERVEAGPPIYELYRKYNIEPVRRLFGIAKECGVRHAVVCGSYFSYFDKVWPEMHLSEIHPYIASRREQEAVALSFADDGFDVAVLELPYIFGVQKGRKPVWTIVAGALAKMKGVTFWPKGGTTMVTVRQVGEAMAGAVERNRGGNCYPIGWYNKTWKEMLAVFHAEMGKPGRKVVSIGKGMFGIAGRMIRRMQTKQGVEGGLNPAKFAPLQCAETYIDKSLGCEPLGVQPADIDAAIADSARLSFNVVLGKAGEVVGMKAE